MCSNQSITIRCRQTTLSRDSASPKWRSQKKSSRGKRRVDTTASFSSFSSFARRNAFSSSGKARLFQNTPCDGVTAMTLRPRWYVLHEKAFSLRVFSQSSRRESKRAVVNVFKNIKIFPLVFYCYPRKLQNKTLSFVCEEAQKSQRERPFFFDSQ